MTTREIVSRPQFRLQQRSSLEPAFFRASEGTFTTIAYSEADQERFRHSPKWHEISEVEYYLLSKAWPELGGAK